MIHSSYRHRWLRRSRKWNSVKVLRLCIPILLFCLYNLRFFVLQAKTLVGDSSPCRLRVVHVSNLSRNDLFDPSCGCSSRETLISAYYGLGSFSKHSARDFQAWNSRFLKLPDNMVIFSDRITIGGLRNQRLHSRGCTVLVDDRLPDTHLGININWYEQYELDPEKEYHSKELYVIWGQKSIWLEQVSRFNPFGSTHFFWTDMGQFRDGTFLRNFKRPNERWVQNVEFIPDCTMALLAIGKFSVHELSSKGTVVLSSGKIRLGGGNFGGDACAVEKWRHLYLEMLQKYIQAGAFAGKDQPVYSSICLQNRDACFIVFGPAVQEADDVWFAMQPVLHGITDPVPEYHMRNDLRSQW